MKKLQGKNLLIYQLTLLSVFVIGYAAHSISASHSSSSQSQQKVSKSGLAADSSQNQESDSNLMNSGVASTSNSYEFCGNGGESIQSLPYGCAYPDGTKYWLLGTNTDSIDYVGGGSYRIQLSAGNTSKFPKDYIQYIELVDEAGAIYRPLDASSSFSPGLACDGGGRFSATLNPHEYVDISGCYYLPNRIHIVGVIGVGMFDEKEYFRFNLDQILDSNN